jgi:hypothetical protein
VCITEPLFFLFFSSILEKKKKEKKRKDNNPKRPRANKKPMQPLFIIIIADGKRQLSLSVCPPSWLIGMDCLVTRVRNCRHG